MRTHRALYTLLLTFVVVPIHAALAADVRIVVEASYGEALKPLMDLYSDLEILTASSSRDFVDKAADADAVIGIYSNVDVEGIVKAGTRLKWIQTMSAGVEGFVRVDTLRDSDILLTNARIVQGPEIADHAMALLLNLTRDMKFFNQQMATGFNRTSRLPLIELRGKTALVIGLGGIGTQVAERCHGFGMRVIAIDPKDIPYMGAVDYVGKPDQLDAILPQADVVISCVPRTHASEGMLGQAQFDLMKEGVYVINVSRGAIIDTEALTRALQSGTVRAAGLDVTDPEPLPADHPLWEMPNVTITPHLAGWSDNVFDRRVELFRDNIERFLKGLPMRHVVDKQRGY